MLTINKAVHGSTRFLSEAIFRLIWKNFTLIFSLNFQKILGITTIIDWSSSVHAFVCLFVFNVSFGHNSGHIGENICPCGICAQVVGSTRSLFFFAGHYTPIKPSIGAILRCCSAIQQFPCLWFEIKIIPCLESRRVCIKFTIYNKVQILYHLFIKMYSCDLNFWFWTQKKLNFSAKNLHKC